MKKHEKLAEQILKVVVAMSDLQEAIENDKFKLDLLNESSKTTGALPCSLNEMINEWQTMANNAQLDALAIFQCWKKSVMFYRHVSPELKKSACLEDDNKLKSDDLVFEDGSYISTGTVLHHGEYRLKFYVEISRDCVSFFEFDNAAQYLWDAHAKEGYGL